VGEIFLKCNAKEIVERCGKTTQELVKRAHGSHLEIPDININGHLEATFPYILSHLEYIIGELLRNSIQAVIEQRKFKDAKPPPIEVLICETSQHVIIRISDQGGGIPNELLPHLWSFTKGPRREKRLENLARVPKLLGTLQELQIPGEPAAGGMVDHSKKAAQNDHNLPHGSLSSLTSRPPNLRLGIGLPMSRVYAGGFPCHDQLAGNSDASIEYWAGSLEIHSLEGFGVDTFLQISKLGNKNERYVACHTTIVLSDLSLLQIDHTCQYGRDIEVAADTVSKPSLEPGRTKSSSTTNFVYHLSCYPSAHCSHYTNMGFETFYGGHVSCPLSSHFGLLC
jgi:pyruvate dehydrogenase kinase 2/3/4